MAGKGHEIMRIIGTAGDDYLEGGFEDDLIEGLGGDDVLEAVDGIDTLRGGAGDDILRFRYGDGALLDGGAGNDTLGSFQEDPAIGVTMTGGAGADDFFVSDGVAISDYEADDRLVLRSGFTGIYLIDDQIERTTEGGTTTFAIDPLAFRYVPFDLLDDGLTFTVASGGGDVAALMAVPVGLDVAGIMTVSDTVLIAPPAAGFTLEEALLAPATGGTLRGDENVFLLTGQGGDDFIVAGDRSAFAAGGGGADEVRGGRGEDVLGGGAGDDTVDGRANADLLYGSGGEDLLIGGDGADALFGGTGDDVLYGDLVTEGV